MRLRLKKPFDIGDLLCEAVRRKRFEEDTAVALALNSWIEEHKDAAVVEAANKAAETLFERDNRIGNLVVEEGFTAEGLDRLHPRFDDWVAGNSEGQPVNDDAT